MKNDSPQGEVLPYRAEHAGSTTEPQAQPRSDRLYEVVDPKSQFCGGIYKHRTSDSDVEYVRKDPPSAALQAQPPERIWIDVNAPQFPGYYFLKPISGISTTEYVRADLPRAAADDDALQDLFDLFERDSQGRWCFKSLSADASKLDKIMDRLATPRVETGLTVEAALVELQEMFPARWVEVINGLNAVGNEYYFVRVYGLSKKPSCTTLDEAMQEVRAWSKSRGEREGE